MADKIYYRRNLPHIIPRGETFFITFRLKDTIPFEVVMRLKAEYDEREIIIDKLKIDTTKKDEQRYNNHKKYFADFDTFLDKNAQKIDYLKNSNIAEVVASAIHFHDEKSYDLHCYSIMPNHVHLLFTHIENAPLIYEIMASIKRYSAVRINKILKKTGTPFWQAESYDHIVRNTKEFDNIVAYILNNPIKADLVDNWEDWKFSYLK